VDHLRLGYWGNTSGIEDYLENSQHPVFWRIARPVVLNEVVIAGSTL
jgi:hypothetical protein